MQPVTASKFGSLKFSFLRGYTDLNLLPADKVPEVALVGRSNVGKSTFLNILTSQKALAKVSAKPGHTREINFYAGLSPTKTTARVHLVDLPGFGFAKIPKLAREQLWQILLEYITLREQLTTVVLLNDCRRLPEDEELGIIKSTLAHGKQAVVVITKGDKLSKNELLKSAREICSTYHHGLGLDQLGISTSLLGLGSASATVPDAGSHISNLKFLISFKDSANQTRNLFWSSLVIE